MEEVCTALKTPADLSSSPIISGDRVTFLWRGPTPVQVIGDFNYWGRDRPPLEMSRAGADTCTATHTLARDAYIEDAFMSDSKRFPDPLTPNSAGDGMGQVKG